MRVGEGMFLCNADGCDEKDQLADEEKDRADDVQGLTMFTILE